MDRISSPALLHPKFRPIVDTLYQNLVRAHEAGRTEFRFEIFETLRLPDRQDDAFKNKVSKARAWESAHQFGLAADFVPVRKRPKPLPNVYAWYWPDADHPDWNLLAEEGHRLGLVILDWDRPHIESPLFAAVRQALK